MGNNPRLNVPANWEVLNLTQLKKVELNIKAQKKGIPKTNDEGIKINENGKPIKKGVRAVMVDYENLKVLKSINILSGELTEEQTEKLKDCSNVKFENGMIVIGLKYGLKEVCLFSQ